MRTMTAPASDGEFRIERDTMGEVRVPAAALYRAQTQRAVENFPISGLTIDRSLIAALAAIKGAAAPLIRPRAATRAGSIGTPEMGKFSTARCVCAR